MVCSVSHNAAWRQMFGTARCSMATTIRRPAPLRRNLQPVGAAVPRPHGLVTVGKDIVEAFVLANYMEENAYRQYMALQIGKPYAFSEEEVALCREKLWNANLFKRSWDHFRAKLG